MDAGPILAQVEVPIEDDDTASSLHERIKAVERVLYPATIAAALRALDDGQPLETITIDESTTDKREMTP